MELRGKNAIVTGAARGIGRGIALKLAEAGANVALVDIGSQKDPALTYNLAAQSDLNRTLEEVKRYEGKAVSILADVTKFADCERMARETAHKLGSVDILVNNAGIIGVGAVATMSEELWDRIMAVNAKGPFLCAKACIPYLTKNKEGAIVNIASIAAKAGRAYWSVAADPLKTLRPSASVTVPPYALGNPFLAGDELVTVTASPIFRSSFLQPFL